MVTFLFQIALASAAFTWLVVKYLNYRADRKFFEGFHDEIGGLRTLPVTRDELPTEKNGYLIRYRGVLNQESFAFSVMQNKKRKRVRYELKYCGKTRSFKPSGKNDVRWYFGASIHGKLDTVFRSEAVTVS